MTAHPVRPPAGHGRARRLAAATLLAGSIVVMSVPTPIGAAPDAATIGPISVPPIALTPALAVPALGLHLPLVANVEVSTIALRLGLAESEVSSPPPAASTAERVPAATPVAAIEAGRAAPISTDIAAARRPLRANLPSPDAETAVVRAERSSTALFVLLAVAIVFLVFLVVQGRVDRRTGLLAAPPLDRREDVLEFP